jgi:hypothetical protein
MKLLALLLLVALASPAAARLGAAEQQSLSSKSW